MRQGKTELTLRYDASGAILSSAPAQDRVFAHNGEEYTPQTGLTYLRARFYDPAQGRFTTEDVYLGNQTKSLSQNRYAYCENDPVNYADPSGYKRSSSSSGGSSGGSSSGSSSSSTSYSYSGGMHTVTTTSGWISSSVSMSTPVWEHVTSNMSAATGYGASSTEVYGYIAGGTSYGEAAASAAAYRAAEAAARAQAAQREQARVKQATDLRRTPQSIAAARGLQELAHQKNAAQAAVQRAASALKLPALAAQQVREMLVNTGKIGGYTVGSSLASKVAMLKGSVTGGATSTSSTSFGGGRGKSFGSNTALSNGGLGSGIIGPQMAEIRREYQPYMPTLIGVTNTEYGGGNGRNFQDGFYSTPNAAAAAFGRVAAPMTQENDMEIMAGLYSFNAFGSTVYFNGNMQEGHHDNVVGSYLLTTIAGASIESLTHGLIRYEGYSHTHPNCTGHDGLNFSGIVGDQGTALVSNNTFLIAPNGVLYGITREHAIEAIVNGTGIKETRITYGKVSKDYYNNRDVDKYVCLE